MEIASLPPRGSGKKVYVYSTLIKPHLWDFSGCLEAKSVLIVYIRTIKDMYDGGKTRVRMVGGDLEHFPIEIGLYQGSVLGLFLSW